MNLLETDDHVCVLYAGPGRRDGALVPFLAEALHIEGRRGYVVEIVDGGDKVGRFASFLEECDLLTSADPSSCCREGCAHLRGLRGAPDDHGGLPPVHAPADMTWLLHVGCDAVETDRRLRGPRTRPRSSMGSHVLLCLYDVQRLPGSAIVDILRTHPKVVTGRLLRRNPYFAAPVDIPEVTA